MQVWKPLLIILPAGLVLGMIGGHYARPVIQQHDGDRPSLPGIKGLSSSGDAAAGDPADDDGGAGQAQVFAGDRAVTGVQGPEFSEQPAYASTSLPSIDELKAEDAARDATPGQRATRGSASILARESAVDAAEKATDDAETAAFDVPNSASGSQFAMNAQPRSRTAASREPRTPDGKLPAIW